MEAGKGAGSVGTRGPCSVERATAAGPVTIATGVQDDIAVNYTVRRCQGTGPLIIE